MSVDDNHDLGALDPKIQNYWCTTIFLIVIISVGDQINVFFLYHRGIKKDFDVL